MNVKQVTDLIIEALGRQAFADFYEGPFNEFIQAGSAEADSMKPVIERRVVAIFALENSFAEAEKLERLLTHKMKLYEFMRKEQLHGLSLSWGNCPECEVPFDDLRVCPKCKQEADSFPYESFISSQTCACCGDTQQGDRVELIAMAPAPKKSKAHSVTKTFIICEDCQLAVGGIN